MKNIYSKYIVFLLMIFVLSSCYQKKNATVLLHDNKGIKLIVNGNDFVVNGMNWDYYPIGTNYEYELWKQPDSIIRAALDYEMQLLKEMGVNAIRQYTGVPQKWIKYIYEEYAIYTMLNHSFGRYGLTLDGKWVGNTEYADERVRKVLLAEVKKMVFDYKDTPGLLFFLIGNENNYGLFWGGSETEDIPKKDEKSIERATAMYKLFNEAALSIKAIDTKHPVAMCNGDFLFLDIIKEQCADVDIFGINMYRGASFGNVFEKVKQELGKAVLFTEFGTDAYHTVGEKEDQQMQAFYLVANWKEIYENVYGVGRTGNCIGGFSFQFSDGWWKTGQTSNLSIHDTSASWANGGYEKDFIQGTNNMNEEWFGICAKDTIQANGVYKLHPRSAYYALQQVHHFKPLAMGVNLESINSHFTTIDLDYCFQNAKKK